MMSDVDPIAPEAWRGPPLASFASRAVALLIDALVLTLGGGAAFFAVLLIVLATVGGGSVESSGEAALLGIGVVSLVTVVAVVAASLYAPLLMARGGRHNGQTLGKHAVGIRVVHTRHPEIGFADAALREIVVKGVVIGLAGSFTFGLAVVLDLAWPLWDAQSRAGHDFLASTRVVDTVEAR